MASNHNSRSCFKVTPSCLPVPGVDITEYKKTLVQRFGNPGVKDQVQRLAEDGSTKIGNQMVPIILENVEAGRQTTYLAKAMATYISYMTGKVLHVFMCHCRRCCAPDPVSLLLTFTIVLLGIVTTT